MKAKGKDLCQFFEDFCFKNGELLSNYARRALLNGKVYRPDLSDYGVSSLSFDELDELPEQWVQAEQGFVAGDEETAAGTGERHVQFAVDDVSVFHEAGGAEEVQLPRALCGERIYDDVALRALIAFHGVDGNVGKRRNAECFCLLADGSYLVAVRHDNADGLRGIEIIGMFAVDVVEQPGHDAGLADIHLVGNTCLAARLGGDEEDPGSRGDLQMVGQGDDV